MLIAKMIISKKDDFCENHQKHFILFLEMNEKKPQLLSLNKKGFQYKLLLLLRYTPSSKITFYKLWKTMNKQWIQSYSEVESAVLTEQKLSQLLENTADEWTYLSFILHHKLFSLLNMFSWITKLS